ncbi:hypothetical protein WKW77_07760 [Variovorax ureilyticus]|uniref:Acyl-CoA dehydrogenase/oxidase C-terminal domain-containing protein n=1 Tax=Variovorax ureilyticus TaxID=1836198 RepID=A0ABU8VCR2_9BURK
MPKPPFRKCECRFAAVSPLIGSTSAMIYGGTDEIQRNMLARQVLGL